MLIGDLQKIICYLPETRVLRIFTKFVDIFHAGDNLRLINFGKNEKNWTGV